MRAYFASIMARDSLSAETLANCSIAETKTGGRRLLYPELSSLPEKPIELGGTKGRHEVTEALRIVVDLLERIQRNAKADYLENIREVLTDWQNQPLRTIAEQLGRIAERMNRSGNDAIEGD